MHSPILPICTLAHLSNSPLVSPSVCLFISCPPAYLSVCLSIHLSACSLAAYPSVCLSVHLSVRLSIHLPFIPGLAGIQPVCLPCLSSVLQSVSPNLCVCSGNTKGGSNCIINLLFDWFELVCLANKNKNCQLTYS